MKRFLADVKMFWKENKWYENIIASIYFIGCVGIIPFAVFVNLTEETMGWRIASIVMIILSVMVWVITIIFIIVDYSDWW